VRQAESVILTFERAGRMIDDRDNDLEASGYKHELSGSDATLESGGKHDETMQQRDPSTGSGVRTKKEHRCE
jgi:hypothetical protein